MFYFFSCLFSWVITFPQSSVSPPFPAACCSIVEISKFDFRNQRSNILSLGHIWGAVIEQPRVNIGPLVDVDGGSLQWAESLVEGGTTEAPVRDLVSYDAR